MKIMAVSDLHGSLEGLDPRGADVVVVAGDLAPMKGWGIWHVNDQVKWINKRFAAWCEAYPEIEFCVVPGNHDLFAQRSDVPTKVVWPKNVRFLVDRLTQVKGLIVAGSPWIPPINGHSAFETEDERDMARRLDWLPEGLDILITHTPPRLSGSNIDVSLDTASPHFGSIALAEAIRRVRPRFHFCGHIHSGDHAPLTIEHGNGRTTVSRNVSRLNERYEVAYEPTWVEI